MAKSNMVAFIILIDSDSIQIRSIFLGYII